jgi:hypothetical protein
MGRRGARALLLAWALVYSRDGEEWEPVDEYASESTCMRVRAASVDRETLDEIGGALAGQPADNPLRLEAYGRAARRVAARYRCRYRAD